MKKVLLSMAVSSLLAACGSVVPDVESEKVEIEMMEADEDDANDLVTKLLLYHESDKQL